MKFISLFAGIGGFDLGLERAGMDCAAQVEIDPFCQQVLAKHWPLIPKIGDIRDAGKHNLPAADLICGGFPCQPFSIAGKQRGQEDDRHLWPEMLRIIDELRPAWVLGENVFNFIRLFLDEALSDLESIGYETRTFVLPAVAFNAPHKRDRVWIVAHAERNQHRRTNTGGLETSQEIPGERWADHSPAGEPRRTGEIWKPGQEHVPNATRIGMEGDGSPWQQEPQSQARQGISGRNHPGTGENYWQVEPGVGRMVDGIPDWMDRIKSLGNAIVPQIAEHFGRMILDIEQEMKSEMARSGR